MCDKRAQHAVTQIKEILMRAPKPSSGTQARRSCCRNSVQHEVGSLLAVFLLINTQYQAQNQLGFAQACTQNCMYENL